MCGHTGQGDMPCYSCKKADHVRKVSKLKCPHCKKPIDDKLINRHFAAKGGKTNKGNKRPDMQLGGKTYEKRWGKKKG